MFQNSFFLFVILWIFIPFIFIFFLFVILWIFFPFYFYIFSFFPLDSFVRLVNPFCSECLKILKCQNFWRVSRIYPFVTLQIFIFPLLLLLLLLFLYYFFLFGQLVWKIVGHFNFFLFLFLNVWRLSRQQNFGNSGMFQNSFFLLFYGSFFRFLFISVFSSSFHSFVRLVNLFCVLNVWSF